MPLAAQQPVRIRPPRVIVFGFLATFASSFGQTFFIGLFNPQFQVAIGVDGSQLGLLYGIATLASGTSLFWLGGMLDRISLPQATALTIGIFTSGTLLAGGASTSILLLLAFFLLRLGGQGFMMHLGIVAAARRDGSHKGKAIAWASMGVIVGEATLPAMVVAALSEVQWRWLWTMIGAVLLLLVLPVLTTLSRGLNWRGDTQDEAQPAGAIHRRRILLRQPTFWASLALLLASPFMTTGFLFEQTVFSRQMHWHPGLIGAAFTVFALCRAFGTWSYGRASDRFGAVPMSRIHLIPMAMAFACLALPLGSASIWAVFAGLGYTNGASSLLGGALWVELFGAASMGLVRGVFMACVVASTAMAPMVLGTLLSHGVRAGAIGVAFAAYCAAAMLLAGPLLHRHARKLAL
ncbi:MAG TPA: MFS transporter [Gammaproteobacteria bacterium]|nr:MFS transporter [Gammaproteobacteria bacterium]